MICDIQGQAKVVIMGNLHVTKDRSDRDKYINNTTINKFNAEIAQFADGDTVFYLDSNVLFDDEDGNLSSEKAIDSAHVKAKHNIEWGDWIIQQSEKLLQDNGV